MSPPSSPSQDSWKRPCRWFHPRPVTVEELLGFFHLPTALHGTLDSVMTQRYTVDRGSGTGSRAHSLCGGSTLDAAGNCHICCSQRGRGAGKANLRSLAARPIFARTAGFGRVAVHDGQLESRLGEQRGVGVCHLQLIRPTRCT